MWCAALVTWGLAAVTGMGIAVFAPDVLPAVGAPAASPAVSRDPSATGPSVGGDPLAAGGAGTSRPSAGVRRPAATRPDETPGARQRAADRAVAYAQARGWRSGVAVIDRSTGATTLAGDADGYFQTQSTVKLLIAARLLAEGRMSRGVEPSARRMLTVSDDPAANALYPLVGGDGLQAWAAARYSLGRFGTPPVQGPGQWGSTQVTPVGMARFLDAVRADRKVGPWLLDALGDMAAIAADGTDQLVGLRAADRLALVKQGWGGDADPSDVEGAPSVGYVDGGRFAVAIYTSRLPESSLATAQSIVSEQARILLPRGHLPPL